MHADLYQGPGTGVHARVLIKDLDLNSGVSCESASGDHDARARLHPPTTPHVQPQSTYVERMCSSPCMNVDAPHPSAGRHDQTSGRTYVRQMRGLTYDNGERATATLLCSALLCSPTTTTKFPLLDVVHDRRSTSVSKCNS